MYLTQHPVNSSDHTVCIYPIVDEISYRSKQHQCRRRRQRQHYKDLAYDNITHLMLLRPMAQCNHGNMTFRLCVTAAKFCFACNLPKGRSASTASLHTTGTLHSR